MKFLEKDLENIIYNNMKKCHDRGLKIGGKGQNGNIFRQVQLGPYGTADLITVAADLSPVYAPWEEGADTYKRAITVTVIECKLDEIGVKAYLQAKRYQAALKEILTYYKDHHTDYIFKTVLIGQSVDTKSDFIFQYMEDHDCTAFLFSYDVEGISFEEVGRTWRKGEGATDDMCYAAEAHVKRIFQNAVIANWNKHLPEPIQYPYKD